MTNGWPLRMTAVLADSSLAQATINAFKEDCELYDLLLSKPDPNARQRAVLKRHCLQWTANTLMRSALEESGWAPTAEFKDSIKKKCSGLVSTQIVEDFVGAAKNDPTTKTARKFRKPETAMANIISKQVVQARHKYKGPEADFHSNPLSTKLSPDCFKPSMSGGSLPFQEVCGTSGATSWYSPSATNVNTPFADLQALRDASIGASFSLLSSASAGAICQTAHRFVFCQRATPDSPPSDQDEWFFAMWQWPDSACLVWPAERRFSPGPERKLYFEPVLASLARPKLITVFNLKRIFACEIKWRSWLWQYLSFPEWRSTLKVTIKAFAEPELPIIKLAATKAFWSMSRCEVLNFCSQQGIHVRDHTSMYSVLADVVGGILGADEERTLAVLSQRLADDEMCNEYSAAIQEVEEAAEVLETSDKEAMEAEKKGAASRLAAREEFKQIYVDEARKFRIAREKEAKKRRKKAEPSGKKQMPTELTQAVARTMIPPDTSIWRGTVNGSWQGHCRPFCRIHESWKKSSEPEAMRRVIKTLWEQWLAKNGMTAADCPWEGLLD